MQKLSKIIKKFDVRIIQYVLTMIFLYLNANEIVHWPIYIILLPLYGPILVTAIVVFVVAILYNMYDFISTKIKHLVKKLSKQKVYENDIELVKTNENKIDNIETEVKIKEENKLDILRQERDKLVNNYDIKEKTKRLSKR